MESSRLIDAYREPGRQNRGYDGPASSPTKDDAHHTPRKPVAPLWRPSSGAKSWLLQFPRHRKRGRSSSPAVTYADCAATLLVDLLRRAPTKVHHSCVYRDIFAALSFTSLKPYSHTFFLFEAAIDLTIRERHRLIARGARTGPNTFRVVLICAHIFKTGALRSPKRLLYLWCSADITKCVHSDHLSYRFIHCTIP